MFCPVCKETELRISERQGVEVDYCPQCRGVWLDRGELDKLIERSTQHEYSAPSAPHQYSAPRREPQYEKRRDYHDDYHHHKRRKKGGWLGEILDFD